MLIEKWSMQRADKAFLILWHKGTSTDEKGLLHRHPCDEAIAASSPGLLNLCP